MELRHLRYFVAVAEEQNVTRAAERLHVSQPPLSRQIRDLEEELGVVLFDRGPKTMRLTSAGELFLEEARQLLEQVEQAIERVRDHANQPAQEIHVGYAPCDPRSTAFTNWVGLSQRSGFACSFPFYRYHETSREFNLTNP